MRKCSNLICIGVFTLCSWLRADAEGPQAQALSLSIQDATMADAVDDLRKQGIVVDLMEKPINTKTDSITLGSALRVLHEKRDKNAPPLTQQEASDLANYERMAAEPSKYPSDAVVDLKRARHSLDIKSTDITSLMDQLVKAYDDYAWVKTNTSFLLEPKGHEHPTGLDLKIDKESAGDALKDLQEALKPFKISISQGGFSMNGQVAWNNMLKKAGVVSLNLESVDLPTMLARFSEALGPDVAFTLLQSEKGGTLVFVPLR